MDTKRRGEFLTLVGIFLMIVGLGLLVLGLSGVRIDPSTEARLLQLPKVIQIGPLLAGGPIFVGGCIFTAFGLGIKCLASLQVPKKVIQTNPDQDNTNAENGFVSSTSAELTSLLEDRGYEVTPKNIKNAWTIRKDGRETHIWSRKDLFEFLSANKL